MRIPLCELRLVTGFVQTWRTLQFFSERLFVRCSLLSIYSEFQPQFVTYLNINLQL